MGFLTKIEVNVYDSFPPGLVCRHADSVHVLGVSCDSVSMHMQTCTVSPFMPWAVVQRSCDGTPPSSLACLG